MFGRCSLPSRSQEALAFIGSNDLTCPALNYGAIKSGFKVFVEDTGPNGGGVDLAELCPPIGASTTTTKSYGFAATPS